MPIEMGRLFILQSPWLPTFILTIKSFKGIFLFLLLKKHGNRGRHLANEIETILYDISALYYLVTIKQDQILQKKVKGHCELFSK